tara:strand:- start:443 stop:640 length:198 start_codon:yes stop_codon:yes gene_type:complete
LQIGDKVKFSHQGAARVGTIIEVFEHKMSGNIHRSLKIQAENFALPVTINITLFPHWVCLIEEDE